MWVLNLLGNYKQKAIDVHKIETNAILESEINARNCIFEFTETLLITPIGVRVTGRMQRSFVYGATCSSHFRSA